MPPVLPVLLPISVVLGASIAFGMHLHFLSVAKSTMLNQVKLFEVTLTSILRADGSKLIKTTADPQHLFSFENHQSLFDIYNSIVNLGAMFGTLTAGYFSDLLGRKLTLLICSPLLIGLTFWLGFEQNRTSLILARLLVGYFVGAMSTIVPCYIAEVSPKELRGMFGALNQVVKTTSGVMVFVIGFFLNTWNGIEKSYFVKPPYKDWRLLMYLHMIPAVVVLLVVFVPETPRWFAMKGKEEKALLALKRLRGGLESQEEVNGLKEQARTKRISEDFFGKLRYTWVMLIGCQRQLLLGCGIMFFVQCTGITFMSSGQNHILQEANIENGDLMSIIVGLTKIISTVGCIFLVDTFGRRTVMLFTVAFCGLGCFGLGLGFMLKDVCNYSWAPMFSLGSIFLYHISYSLGVGAVPWVICSEIFPNRVRGLASSFAVATMWLTSFVVVLMTDRVKEGISYHGVFFGFGGITFVFFLFLFFLLPETKGKTLEEVEGLFKTEEEEALLN